MAAREKSAIAIFDINLATGTVALAFVLLSAAASQAQTYNVLANFGGTNGAGPLYITLDTAGNLYGTTEYGTGNASYGTVFKVTHHGSNWTQATLYVFTGQSDGNSPDSPVVFGPDGSLYGTTIGGGLYGHGVIYKLQPPAAGCRTSVCYWTETVLHNFDGSDGDKPQGNLIFDHAGNLYGTTIEGGQSGDGTVFELTPSQGQWNLTTLHSFSVYADGGEPYAGVIFDQAGNLYGTTVTGGPHFSGMVYELTPGTLGWTETILYNFMGGADGGNPGGLVFDAGGNLFGYTEFGGSGGNAYELQAGNGGFTFSNLFYFHGQSGDRPSPGQWPLLDSAGNLYGTCSSGGSGAGGVVFKLTSYHGQWIFTLLHDFSPTTGYQPQGNVVFDAAGNLYGAAFSGGAEGDGAVWEITP